MYYVGQKRIEIDKERSLGNRLAEARERAVNLHKRGSKREELC